jgi:phage gp36-like protein
MYCTQIDIEERFGQPELSQLTDRTRSGVVDVTAVARAIADASAEVDGYTSGK